jgi:nucleotide-binding universal stress UspA family protein
MIKHLLVHVDGSERSSGRTRIALGLARRFQARLTGLFAEAEVLGGSLVGRRSRERFMEAAQQARATFLARTANSGVDTQWWQLAPGEYADLVGLTAACSRYADLAVFGQHHPDDQRVPEDLVEQVILNAGRPVLVVPWAGDHVEVGRRVVVAWNASRESARALGDALPLLAEAEDVTVLAFQNPGSGPGPMPDFDVAAYLGLHGIAARYERVVKEPFAVVDSVLNRCFELTADLVVVGGYGLSGLPLLQRESTTRKILRAMTAPVLLSH